MEINYIVLDDKLTYEAVSAYASLLPQERQLKIARYRSERDKLRSLCAGLLIRHAVGDAPLTYGEHGKPHAPGAHFSVSHSGAVVAIAVDREPVGLDVERLPDDSRLRVAGRFFHPDERRCVAGADDPRRAFCRVWTRKEAYLKMTGEGISTDLTAFSTCSPEIASSLFTLDLSDYVLSVCSRRPLSADAVRITRLQWRELLS